MNKPETELNWLTLKIEEVGAHFKHMRKIADAMETRDAKLKLEIDATLLTLDRIVKLIATMGEIYLTPKDLMQRFPGVSAQTLANWRSGNGRPQMGPPFLKAGGHILYPASKLLGWETKMTSDPEDV